MGVLLLQTSPDLAGLSLLPSGGFEGEGTGLPPGWALAEGARTGGGPAGPEWTWAAEGRSGRSMRAVGREGCGSWRLLWTADPVPVEPGERLVLSGWMRAAGVSPGPGQFANANLILQLYDERGQVVRAGRSPVVGSRVVTGTCDWTFVAAAVDVPDAARSCRAGCFLSMDGTVEFDDVMLIAPGRIRWTEVADPESPYVYRFLPGGEPTDAERAANRAALARTAAYLGVDPPARILYYIYPSNDAKGVLTGDRGNAHVAAGKTEIHSIFATDAHEIVHVLTREWGDPSPLYGEGLAVLLSGGWRGQSLDAACRDIVRQGPLPDVGLLADLAAFRGASDLVTYPAAGFFCQEVLRRFGRETLLALYRDSSSAAGAAPVRESFRARTGADADAFWAEARASLVR